MDPLAFKWMDIAKDTANMVLMLEAMRKAGKAPTKRP